LISDYLIHSKPISIVENGQATCSSDVSAESHAS
jgi:hypothetical protein